MELLQLQYFRELARNGHLSRTAEKLHIAQPSLSQMLKRLENELGISLFNRTRKGIILNDSGKIFLKYVDEVFSALDNATLELESSQKQSQKTVALHICSASMFLPEIVRRIQKADADVRLKIFQRMDGTQGGDPSLFLTSSPVYPKDDTCIQVLLRENIMTAIPKDNLLAEKAELTWEDLKSETFLSLAPESNLSTAVRYFCEAKGVHPNVTTYVDTPAVLRDLLRLNLGIAFVPEDTWKGFATDTVVLRTVADLPMQRYLLLSWDKSIYQTSAWKLCKTIITDFFQEKNML